MSKSTQSPLHPQPRRGDWPAWQRPLGNLGFLIVLLVITGLCSGFCLPCVAAPQRPLKEKWPGVHTDLYGRKAQFLATIQAEEAVVWRKPSLTTDKVAILPRGTLLEVMSTRGPTIGSVSNAVKRGRPERFWPVRVDGMHGWVQSSALAKWRSTAPSPEALWRQFSHQLPPDTRQPCEPRITFLLPKAQRQYALVWSTTPGPCSTRIGVFRWQAGNATIVAEWQTAKGPLTQVRWLNHADGPLVDMDCYFWQSVSVTGTERILLAFDPSLRELSEAFRAIRWRIDAEDPMRLEKGRFAEIDTGIEGDWLLQHQNTISYIKLGVSEDQMKEHFYKRVGNEFVHCEPPPGVPPLPREPPARENIHEGPAWK